MMCSMIRLVMCVRLNFLGGEGGPPRGASGSTKWIFIVRKRNMRHSGPIVVAAALRNGGIDRLVGPIVLPI
eukprot:4284269-Heterocapsa_arctica.AAC.1